MIILDQVIFYSLIWAVFWIPYIAVPHGVLCKNFMDLGLELALLAWLVKLIITRKTNFVSIDKRIQQSLFFVALASFLSIPFSIIKIWSIGDFLGILIGIFAVYLFTSVIKSKEQFLI
ncbi:MAG: hypothetical protein KKA19_01185, partial [Candidatus Margulisbacteria bacterium]|nr:hypothetical protein [Candidatus Margulisiibacteriota bacterium]